MKNGITIHIAYIQYATTSFQHVFIYSKTTFKTRFLFEYDTIRYVNIIVTKNNAVKNAVYQLVYIISAYVVIERTAYRILFLFD